MKSCATGSACRAMAKTGTAISQCWPVIRGVNSYNTRAGMNRLLTNAAFVHSNMPLETVWSRRRNKQTGKQ